VAKITAMTAVPEGIVLERDRDLAGGRGSEIWLRRGLLALLPLLVLLALLNVFGQRPQTSTAFSSAAQLQLYAPSTVRGGLMYTARFRIDARRELKNATLVLDPGWADQYTVNGVSPQPSNEESENGKLSFSLGDIPAGSHQTLFMSLQVNPTNVGHHAQTVWLYDGEKQLATIRHTITIWP
jgi:hypothetical protein